MIKPAYLRKHVSSKTMGDPRGAEWEVPVEFGLLINESNGEELFPGILFEPTLKLSPSGDYSLAREFESCAWRLIEHSSGRFWPLLSDGDFSWEPGKSGSLHWSLKLLVDVVNTGELGARGQFNTLALRFNPSNPTEGNYIVIEDQNAQSFFSSHERFFRSTIDLGDSNEDVDRVYDYIVNGKPWTRTLKTDEWVGIFAKDSPQVYVMGRDAFEGLVAP